jgi:hypothetical protein
MFEKIKKWYNTNNRYKSDSGTLFELIRLMDYSKENSSKSTEENLYDYLYKNSMAFGKIEIIRSVNNRNSKKEMLLSIIALLIAIILTTIFVNII